MESTERRIGGCVDRRLLALARLQVEFTLAPDFVSVSEAMAAASWNLCMVSEERRNAGMDDMCWYEEPQRFQRIEAVEVIPFTVRSGEWYLQIHGDYFGLVGGHLMDASDAARYITKP